MPTFLGSWRLFISEEVEEVEGMKGREGRKEKRKERRNGERGAKAKKEKKRKSAAELNWVLLELVGDISSMITLRTQADPSDTP